MENINEVLPILRGCSIFDELSDSQLEAIAPHLYEVYFHPGSFIIHQGELGTELFIIKHGKVEVLKKAGNSGKYHLLTTISQGEVFGELAIIDNGYRSASIRAGEATTLYVLTSNALHTLDADVIAGIYRGLAIKLSQRLRFINDITMKSVEREYKEKRNYSIIVSCIMLVFLCAVIYSYSLGSSSCLLKSMVPGSAVSNPNPNSNPSPGFTPAGAPQGLPPVPIANESALQPHSQFP